MMTKLKKTSPGTGAKTLRLSWKLQRVAGVVATLVKAVAAVLGVDGVVDSWQEYGSPDLWAIFENKQ